MQQGAVGVLPTTRTQPWHALPIDQALRSLEADSKGLSAAQAKERLERDGPNEIRCRRQPKPWLILLHQFESSIVLLLIAACILSAILGDWKDTIAILAILVLNAFQGFRQEYRAEKALAALESLAAPTVTVRRDDHTHTLRATELVRGDVVLIAAGNLIPADCRLLEAQSFRVQEAALTGESVAVDKSADGAVSVAASLGDRRNMIYAGTVAVQGRATAIVVETGRATELGRIAGLLEGIARDPTPLQRKLDGVSRKLGYAAIALMAIIVAQSVFRGIAWRDAALLAISTAVAAVPEGLPAAITIVLAIGSERMLRRNALLRRLSAIETLGSVSVICSDKTGTLTQNRMRVTSVGLDGQVLKIPTAERDENIELVFAASALCCDVEHGEDGSWIGEPTEVALVEAAAAAGFDKTRLDSAMPRTAETPFDSAARRMTTVHRVDAKDGVPALLSAFADPHVSIVKGAFDALLPLCSSHWSGGRSLPLDSASSNRWCGNVEQMAADGLRVLAVAVRSLAEESTVAEGERGLTLIGVAGLMDPPRPEARDAIRKCREAGIRPVMITGDHPLTARRIAADLGMHDGDAVTGSQIDSTSPEEFLKIVAGAGVYARVSPEHKLNIVEALQKQRHIVAMTGDGVNDAPALKRANVGVAMGRIGTDVAREAADMVLQDDNFATIVSAVEEGRAIQDNLHKFLRYLLTCNASEVLIMVVGPILGLPPPLLPVQILWMNLVTDGLPALALGLEPPEPDVMKRPPSRSEDLLNRETITSIVGIGTVLASVTLVLGLWVWKSGDPAWQSLIFTFLTFQQLALAMALRVERRILGLRGLFANRLLVAALLITFLLHMAILYWAPARGWMGTLALSPMLLGISIGLSVAVFVAMEIGKLIHGAAWPKRRPQN